MSVIHHSLGVNNALGGQQILFKGDKILEIQTGFGALLFLNDTILIGQGINAQNN